VKALPILSNVNCSKAAIQASNASKPALHCTSTCAEYIASRRKDYLSQTSNISNLIFSVLIQLKFGIRHQNLNFKKHLMHLQNEPVRKVDTV